MSNSVSEEDEWDVLSLSVLPGEETPLNSPADNIATS